MKKTLKSGFGRRPQKSFQFFSIILLVWLESSYMATPSLLACLILDMSMKKTLKYGFGRRPKHKLNIFLIIPSV